MQRMAKPSSCWCCSSTKSRSEICGPRWQQSREPVSVGLLLGLDSTHSKTDSSGSCVGRTTQECARPTCRPSPSRPYPRKPLRIDHAAHVSQLSGVKKRQTRNPQTCCSPADAPTTRGGQVDAVRLGSVQDVHILALQMNVSSVHAPCRQTEIMFRVSCSGSPECVGPSSHLGHLNLHALVARAHESHFIRLLRLALVGLGRRNLLSAELQVVLRRPTPDPPLSPGANARGCRSCMRGRQHCN